MDGKVEIIEIDESNFGEWVEAQVAVDGVKCLPFQFTRRTWNEIRNDRSRVLDFLYKFGKSMNEKCGTASNPLPQHMIEGRA